jgi:single-strand DNA-binding protein
MSSVNKVTILGTLGRDPQITSFPSGDRIAEFSIATNERWTDKATGEKKEKTDWHKIVIRNLNFVKVAENYLKKGQQVYVEGQLQTREWTNKDGVKNHVTEVVVGKFKGEVVLLGGKDRDARPSQESTRRSFADDLEADIPF